MDYLPIFMNMRGRHAVVVGGGLIASRKATLVAKSGARITIVSPTIAPAMRTLVEQQKFAWIERAFQVHDLDDACLVVAATDDPAVNRDVHAQASCLRIPVNVVDTPTLCSFILPAIVDRSPAVIAISTGGRSPVLARFTKTLLERLVPARLGRLAAICGDLRKHVAARVADPGQRRRFWEGVLEGAVPELVYSGREAEAISRINHQLDRASCEHPSAGSVYLIGAGPGDPELLTLKALRLLQRADVVLYDRLVPVGILDLCRREAELIYVGKRHGDHPLAQEEISKLLVRHAQLGKRVARLKGGDPFIFGRGGEELEALVQARIDFQVVPGVSAANGCAAYAGIPLTHRDHAQSVSFWTGHTRNGVLDLDWGAMCTARQTLVFYMGSMSADTISTRLIDHGMAPTTPVAVVQAATTVRQRVVRTSLHHLKHSTDGLDATLPTLIIVGSVVNLQQSLGWYETSPNSTPVFPPHQKLAGQTVSNHAA